MDLEAQKVDLTRTKVGSDADEVAMMIDGAQKVINCSRIWNGCFASQHQVKEFADLIAEKYGTEVHICNPPCCR